MALLRPLTWSTLRLVATPLTAVAVLTSGTAPAPVTPAPTTAPEATTPPSRPAVVTSVALAVDPADAVEARAIEVAHGLGAVPADAAESVCPREDLEVRWSEPEGFTHGAFVAPVGPPPGRATEAVNGIVVCADSRWAFMGFEAVRDGEVWQVSPVPYVVEGEGDPAAVNLDADPAATTGGNTSRGGAPTAVAPPAAGPAPSVPTSAWLAGLGPIEPYAAYEPQASCSPTAKPGTVVLRDALLAAHPGTRNLGITRACHIGGRSEHKEGRAFDWGALINRPAERAAVDRFLTQLFATDADGNRHALARRLGVMYVVWNRQIWSSARASDGWRAYHGPSPHTDHIHISLNRAAAAGRTSFFTAGLAQQGVFGAVPPSGMPLPAAPVLPPPPAGTDPVSAAPAGDDEPREPRRKDRREDEAVRREEDTLEPVTTADDRDDEDERDEAEKREEDARRQAEKAAEAARRAEEQAQKAASKAREKARDRGKDDVTSATVSTSTAVGRSTEAPGRGGRGEGGGGGEGKGKGVGKGRGGRG